MDKSMYSKTPKEAGKFHAYVSSAKTTLTAQGRNVTQNVMTFAKTTSIKGLPRIINSDLKLMRVVWLTATVGFLILAALQAMILWQQFATGQTVIITEELQWSDDEAKDIDFPPAMTLCDAHSAKVRQRPQADDNSSDVEHWRQFAYRIDEMYQEMGFPEDLDYEGWASLARMYKTGYLETVGLENIHNFAKETHDFVAYCTLKLVPFSDNNQILNCSDVIEVTPVFHPTYPTCYRFHVPQHLKRELEALTGQILVGYNMVIYTGAFNESLDINLGNYWEILDDSAGVLFAVHDTESLMPKKERNTLAPGYWHSVDVTTSIRERMPTRKDDSCIDGKQDEFYTIYSHAPLKYSQKLCMSACVDDTVLHECGCMNPDSMHSEYRVPHDTKYCSHVGGNLNETIQRLECARRHNHGSGGACTKQCANPCKEIYYSYTHSFAKWPTTLQKLQFYEILIELNPHLTQQFADYDTLDQYNASDVMEFLQNDRRIEDNFLQLTVTSMQTTIIKMSDVPHMTFTNFMCQLGGVLNLYAGITMVVLVELIELLVHIIKPYIIKLQSRCQQDNSKNNVQPINR